MPWRTYVGWHRAWGISGAGSKSVRDYHVRCSEVYFSRWSKQIGDVGGGGRGLWSAILLSSRRRDRIVAWDIDRRHWRGGRRSTLDCYHPYATMMWQQDRRGDGRGRGGGCRSYDLFRSSFAKGSNMRDSTPYLDWRKGRRSDALRRRIWRAIHQPWRQTASRSGPRRPLVPGDEPARSSAPARIAWPPAGPRRPRLPESLAVGRTCLCQHRSGARETGPGARHHRGQARAARACDKGAALLWRRGRPTPCSFRTIDAKSRSFRALQHHLRRDAPKEYWRVRAHRPLGREWIQAARPRPAHIVASLSLVFSSRSGVLRATMPRRRRR